jgi:hypothetical protein
MLTDDQRIAWERVNWALDTYGDGPEYRKAWHDWATVSGVHPQDCTEQHNG